MMYEQSLTQEDCFHLDRGTLLSVRFKSQFRCGYTRLFCDITANLEANHGLVSNLYSCDMDK